MHILDKDTVTQWLPKRPKDSHKGTYGKLGIWAGSLAYPGSAYLAAGAAYRSGCGLVSMAAQKELIPSYELQLPEAVYIPLTKGDDFTEAISNMIASCTAVLIGPGLGQDQWIKDAFAALLRMIDSLEKKPSLILDADALNMLRDIEEWHVSENTILTPHPKEFLRLTHTDFSAWNTQESYALAQKYANQWDCVVVLKQAASVIAAPDKEAYVYNHPDPLLSTAGTGDVLAGIISGLCAQSAQGIEPMQAACLGVYIHGQAAQNLQHTLGDRGMLASDLLEQIPVVMRTLEK